MKHKRIKIPSPEFFRYQQFISDSNTPKVICFGCDKETTRGIHDLELNLLYCFDCANEDGVKKKPLPYVSNVKFEKDGDVWIGWDKHGYMPAHIYDEDNANLYSGAKALRDALYAITKVGGIPEAEWKAAIEALKAVNVEVEE